MALVHQPGEKVPRGEKEAAIDQRTAEYLGQAQVLRKEPQPLLEHIVGEHRLADRVRKLAETNEEIGILCPNRLVTGQPHLVDRAAELVALLLQVRLEAFPALFLHPFGTITPIRKK